MKRQKGFTLVELLVVMAIIGILMGIAVPKYNEITENAKISTFQSNHKLIASAITMYIAEHAGAYPTSMDALFPKYISGDTDGDNKHLKDIPDGATYTLTYNATTKVADVDSVYKGKNGEVKLTTAGTTTP